MPRRSQREEYFSYERPIEEELDDNSKEREEFRVGVQSDLSDLYYYNGLISNYSLKDGTGAVAEHITRIAALVSRDDYKDIHNKIKPDYRSKGLYYDFTDAPPIS